MLRKREKQVEVMTEKFLQQQHHKPASELNPSRDQRRQ